MENVYEKQTKDTVNFPEYNLCFLGILVEKLETYGLLGRPKTGAEAPTVLNVPIISRNYPYCYDAIEQDLLEAIRLMDPASVRGNNGYARKESAQALLARLYLYKGEWQKCIDICDELIGSDAGAVLESEVTTLFSTAQTSKEVLWCVNLTDGDMAGFNPKSLIASMYDSPDGTQGTGWGELYVADPLLDLFERYPQDDRYKDLIRLSKFGNDGILYNLKGYVLLSDNSELTSVQLTELQKIWE